MPAFITHELYQARFSALSSKQGTERKPKTFSTSPYVFRLSTLIPKKLGVTGSTHSEYAFELTKFHITQRPNSYFTSFIKPDSTRYLRNKALN